MLTDREREKLLERQARVYEVADWATKPEQWFIGGLKLVFLAVVVTGVAIGTPIYTYFHAGHVDLPQIFTAVLAVGGLALLFVCPWYTVVGGILFWGAFGWWLNEHQDQTTFQNPKLVFLTFIAIGWAQWLIRKAVVSYMDSGTSCPLSGEDSQPTFNTGSFDSGPSGDARRRLSQTMQSISDDMEYLLKKRAEERLVQLGSMPIGDALRLAVSESQGMARRVRKTFHLLQQGAYDSREDASDAVRELRSMLSEATAMYSTVIARLRNEGGFSQQQIHEYEETLESLCSTARQLEVVALEKGLTS